jgi:recombination protein RecA
MKSAAQVCAQVGAALEPRGLQKDVGVASSFTWRQDRAPEVVLTGVTAIDTRTGGLPRAGLTEISGPPSSGRMMLELALLASLTVNGESCALIDAEDAFDPASAEAMGVDLDRLLWVRCQSLEQALSATDLVLGAGGFGAVVLDLAGVPVKRARRVPLSYWFRFRRAVEGTPTVLALIDEEPCAQSAASLVLRLETEGAHWSTMLGERRNLESTDFADPGISKPPLLADVLPRIPSHGQLLNGIHRRAEVVRNRNARPGTLKRDDDLSVARGPWSVVRSSSLGRAGTTTVGLQRLTTNGQRTTDHGR